jgi:hypothetical protein
MGQIFPFPPLPAPSLAPPPPPLLLLLHRSVYTFNKKYRAKQMRFVLQVNNSVIHNKDTHTREGQTLAGRVIRIIRGGGGEGEERQGGRGEGGGEKGRAGKTKDYGVLYTIVYIWTVHDTEKR